MLSVFKKFLRSGDGKVSIPKIFFAARYTRQFYKERSALKKTHKLRARDLPGLFKLQRKFDALQSLSLQKAIFQQHLKEKSQAASELMPPSKFSKIRSFLHSEHEKFKDQGLQAYTVSKALAAKSFVLARITPDFLSQWIVRYVNLYHKALEEMVEGHREVTRNHDTVLQDGETVRQKLEKFEEKLVQKQVEYKLSKKDDKKN